MFMVYDVSCRGLADLQHQDIVKNADELAGGEYNLTNLQSCTIQLQGPMSSLHLRNLTECTVEAGPVSGPVFVHGKPKLTSCAYQHNHSCCSAHLLLLLLLLLQLQSV